LLMTTFYTSVLIFISFSSTMIIELWLPNNASLEENQKIAGDLMSIPYMCCTFFSPFVGYMVDKVG
jgi:MFS family permease